MWAVYLAKNTPEGSSFVSRAPIRPTKKQPGWTISDDSHSQLVDGDTPWLRNVESLVPRSVPKGEAIGIRLFLWENRVITIASWDRFLKPLLKPVSEPVPETVPEIVLKPVVKRFRNQFLNCC